MGELKAVVEAARVLRAADEVFVCATVVRVRGSGYRRPGARMLAAGNRWVAGSISGGCLERDVLARGAFRTRERAAVLVRHDEALDERTGSGCEGEIDVLLERCERPGPCDPFLFAEQCFARELPGVLLTVFRSARPDVPVGARLSLLDGEVSASFEDAALRAELAQQAQLALAGAARHGLTIVSADGRGGELEALVERFEPAPHLFVFGGAHDALPLLALAGQLGWSRSVWDGQPRLAGREPLRAAARYLDGPLAQAVSELERCARPLAVVMGHHYEQDRAVLAALLPGRAHYLGVLGPRRRTQRMLDDCREHGVPIDDAALARVFAPIGLQLGAETPAEIALSIVAEIQSVLTDSSGLALREHQGPIHCGEP